MTPVGHSIIGATIAAAVMPSTARRRTKALLIASFVLLANVPDARFSGWGHDRYDISHSLFVNAMLIALCTVLLACLPRARRLIGGRRIMLGGAGAWLSHLLLDSFYNHGRGLAIFWPFSRARLALPIPWLDNLHHRLPCIDFHTVKVTGLEMLTFGSIFVSVLLVRWFVGRDAGQWLRRDCYPEHPQGW